MAALLESWAEALQLPSDERSAWRDAGLWHDALRDAPESDLRALLHDDRAPAEILHGPAAAHRLRLDGEARDDVLSAIEFHTIGCAEWGRTGRALYLADYLEPGRSFMRERRAFLAGVVVTDFQGVLREVVRSRLESALTEGYEIHPNTVALWNSLS